jgi:hypothetical protein
MQHRPRIRTLAAVPSALLVLALVAQPAFAFDVLSDSGAHGNWAFHDVSGGPRGANCIYQNSLTPKLLSISVRFPVVYGRFAQSQKVGWSFQIQRQDPLPQDPSQTYWHDIYVAPVVKASATLSTPAAFSRRAWTAGTHPKHQFRVLVTMNWYKRGAPTVLTGSVVGRVQWYKAKRGTSSYETADYCLQEY